MKLMLKTVMFGVVALALLVGGLLILRPAFADSIFHPEEAGVRVITHDANTMITEHAKGVEKVLATQSYKGEGDTVDLDAYTNTRRPKAHEVALASLKRREMIAEAKGELMPRPSREIRGNTWHWIQTDIAVYGCMKITAAGKIWRDGGTDPAAGPDGEDYSINPLHASKTMVVPGLRWGTFIGKVCDEQDKKGDRCGAKMPLGSTAYRSPNQIIAGQQVGAGKLSVWTNQFGTETDRSDYNIGQGGFTFDAEPAPAYMCDAVTTVANR